MGCTNSKQAEPKDELQAELENYDFPDLTLLSAPPALESQAPVTDTEDSAFVTVAATSRWKLAGPSVPGDLKAVWAPFAYQFYASDGLYIYSDTSLHEVMVIYKTSADLPAGDAEKSKEGDKHVFTLKVLPGETKCLWKGPPAEWQKLSWTWSGNAKGISEDYCRRQAQLREPAINAEIAAMQTISQSAAGNPDAALSALVCHPSKSASASGTTNTTEAMFVDLEFKPCAASLGPDMPIATWLRPSQFLPVEHRSRVALINNRVEPNDIDQGQLGDCWFLCAIASVAEDPEKIKDMFRHPRRDAAAAKQERARGAYRVTVNKHGWWHNLIVDDYLPTLGGVPCFAKNVQEPAELWVALLEKAYARLHGSYKAIAGGDARQALQDLTGYPTERFPDFNEDPDGLFQRILAYDKAGYMINLNTPGEDDSAYMGKSGAGNSKEFAERYKKAGLGMGHAYSVLVAKAFPQHGLQLVKIRNPWGNGTEWTGAWSDNSELWNQYPDVKAECNLQTEGDGTFWMSWTDAREYFDSGGVCYVERNWFDYRVKNRFNECRPDVVLSVTVKEQTDVYFTVSQRDRRGLAENDPDRQYHSVMITVCETEGDMYRPLRNSNWKAVEKPQFGYGYCSARDLSMKVTLEPRDEPYLIVPRAHSTCKASKDFVLGMISSKPVDENHLTVKFVRPAEDWPCYKNYSRFPNPEAPSATTEFQFNPEEGCPMTFTSDALFTQHEL